MLLINVPNCIIYYLGRVLGYFPTSAIQNSSSFSDFLLLLRKVHFRVTEVPLCGHCLGYLGSHKSSCL